MLLPVCFKMHCIQTYLNFPTEQQTAVWGVLSEMLLLNNVTSS